VTVLFCDLVGFTTLSEHRDPEDVRELLSRYFDLARAIVDRYGGMVEKFIGDAVMAVWGVPTANEDDAERAVRAALELVAAVEKLGDEAALPGLAARAGVLSGDAAVTLGATGQGMVAGDLVNTASRLQSAADAGSVLAGETTYLASRDAIAFDEQRELFVKGKAEPVSAWRALRVVAQRRGAGRSTQLEPPFVGRDEQLRLLVDLLHSTGRERKARLVSVTGMAGIGKSRLVEELLKYVDGLAETVFWHHGRCPAYGEGITFWALAEMVRMRARISELEDDTTARRKLAAVLEEYVEDAEERRWIEPCLTHLLGLSEPATSDHQELFSAWRTFFERIAERGTVVMVFEDMQWADTGLLDFAESLAEWSRSHPILVVTLSRPELADRRPAWGAGTRDFTSLHLDPLGDDAMRTLLHGLVRGLPDDVTEQLVRRADGVPLHAVETVRSLLDQGIVVQLDDGYELLGEVRELELPDSLQALIASRLDTLPAPERALLQDAAVLGTTFSTGSLATVAATEEATLMELLRDLVRREFLTVDTDPRSPERGQYGFVQGVVREVAYRTLSKRDRRVKHLASAQHFEAAGDEELSGLVATHYLEAYRATGEGAERDEMGALARRWLERAAERALSLGSTDQALVYAEEALDVTPEGTARVALLCLASKAARMATDDDRALAHSREAITLSEAAGDPVWAGRAAMELLHATSGLSSGSHENYAVAIGKGREVLSSLPDTGAEEVVADLSMAIAMLHHSAGDNEASLALAERAIQTAERLDDTLLLGRALNMRAAALFSLGRHREAAIVQRGVTAIFDAAASVHDQAMSRLFESLFVQDDDPRGAIRAADEAAELARRAGDRSLESVNVLNAVEMNLLIGEWAAAHERLEGVASWIFGQRHQHAAWKDILDATLQDLTQAGGGHPGSLDRLQAVIDQNEYVHMRTTYLRARALVCLAHGELDQARSAVGALLEADPEGINTVLALGYLGHAALWQGDTAGAREALERMASFHGRWTLAARATIGAGLAVLDGRKEGAVVEAAARFRDAAASWRSLDVPIDIALCGVDAAILLSPDDQPTELVEEARRILEGLGAAPLLAQLSQRAGTLTHITGR
jgi:class 3 adenylate cyclase/tetratricopeptide (TPR) repeat protein